jgi:hypothetical protein
MNRGLRISEIAINYLSLTWLIIYSITLQPWSICIFPFENIENDDIILYLITIIFTITSIIFIIWRIRTPETWLRKTSMILAIPTIIWTLFTLTIQCFEFD